MCMKRLFLENNVLIGERALNQSSIISGPPLGNDERSLVSLSWKSLDGTLNVASVEVEDGLRSGFGIASNRSKLTIAFVFHVLEDTDEVFDDELDSEGPGGVGVSNSECHVGNISAHHSLVNKSLRNVDNIAIYGHRDATKHLDVQTSGCYDDVSVQLASTLEGNATFVEFVNMVGHNRGSARTQALEEVRIGDDANSLIPWVVRRSEVFLNVGGGSLENDPEPHVPASNEGKRASQNIGAKDVNDVFQAS